MFDAAQKLREICLALPEATEVAMRRGPSYRVEEDFRQRTHRGRAPFCLGQGAGEQPGHAARRRSRALLFAALLWLEGLGRNAARQRAGLERGHGFREAQLSARRAQTPREVGERRVVGRQRLHAC